MKLKSVLQFHDRFKHPKQIQKNLGDAYLLNHNPVFATIRELALEAGFKMRAERWAEYEALALVELPRVLKSKTIPFTDNVGVLRKLEKSNPGGHNFEALPPIKMNPIFHESAHAVAHALSGFKVGQRKLKSIEAERTFALELLLQESFANATECFANVYSDTEIHDEFFYLNSYVIEEPVHRVAIVKMVQVLGKEMTFKVLMLSFLHANFLKTKNAPVSFKKVLSFLGLDQLKKGEQNRVKDVFKIGLLLDPEFTEETNAFCLKHLGIKTPLQKLFAFDFMKEIHQQQKLSLAFQRFSKVALGY